MGRRFYTRAVYFYSKVDLTYQSLAAIVPIYVMILTGVLVRRTGWLKPEADSSFVRMAIDVTLPCFIIYNMLGNEKLKSVGFSLATIFIGMLVVLASLAVSYATSRLLRLKVGSGERTFVVTTAFHNYGFFIIALVAILFAGSADSELLGLVLTHNVGCDLIFWSVGLFLLSNSSKFSVKVFLRGPVIAVFIGLFLIWTGIGEIIPDFVSNSMKWIGGCAIPMNLFMFGALICDMYGHSKIDYRVVATGVFVRMAVMPLIFIIAAWLLPVDLSLKKLIVLQALPPCAVTAAVLSKDFNGKPDLSVHITLATCFVAIFTLPLWMNFGFSLIGAF